MAAAAPRRAFAALAVAVLCAVAATTASVLRRRARNSTTLLWTGSVHSLAGLGGGAAPAKAADASNPCISRSEGAVMGGCDVIAYAGLANASSDGRAAPNCTLGLEEYTESYAGFAFRFATADHQAAFAADPARYAPAYGGFCGYGMCCEDWWTPGDVEADVNPNVWVYVDGRLLSFRGHEPMEAFLANKSANLAAADARWEGWAETYGTPVFNTLCAHYGY